MKNLKNFRIFSFILMLVYIYSTNINNSVHTFKTNEKKIGKIRLKCEDKLGEILAIKVNDKKQIIFKSFFLLYLNSEKITFIDTKNVLNQMDLLFKDFIGAFPKVEVETEIFPKENCFAILINKNEKNAQMNLCARNTNDKIKWLKKFRELKSCRSNYNSTVKDFPNISIF